MGARRPRLLIVAAVMAVAVGALGTLVAMLPGRGVVAPSGPAENAVNFDRLFHAGIQLLRAGRAEDAITAFEDARRLRPHVAAVHVNIGFARLALGRHDQARHAFETALTIAPGQINAYYGLAESLNALGDIDGALGAMRTYLHRAPSDEPFRRKAAAALWELEETRAQAARAAATSSFAPHSTE